MDDVKNKVANEPTNQPTNEPTNESIKDTISLTKSAPLDALRQYVLNLPLHNEVFFAMVGATANAVAVSEKYWQKQGLNGARIRVLVEIAKHGGEILPSLLAERIGVTKANISLLLIPLEKDGYITRGSHALDGRKTVITLTAAGQMLLTEQLPGNRAAVEGVMSRLDEGELRQLLRLLNKLSESI